MKLELTQDEAKKLVGKYTLHYAAMAGNDDLIKLALFAGADINARTEFVGGSALEFATHELWYDDDGNYTPIHLAAKNGRFATVKLLADRGADLNCLADSKNGVTLAYLIVAVQRRWDHKDISDNDVLDCLRYVSKRGCDLNRDHEYNTRTPFEVALNRHMPNIAAGIEELIAEQSEPKLPIAMPRRQAVADAKAG